MTGVHTEHEADGWTIDVGDHAARADSPTYIRSRRTMIAAVKLAQPWVFGDAPYQDHHGGGCWVLDGDTPRMYLLPFGIEWSSQFCADPARIEIARLAAEALVAAFPETEKWYTDTLGMSAVDLTILHTPITTADQVALWTDSFWNASVPLPATSHTGTLPGGAGYHHYPKPIVDIEMFKRDNFTLFVTQADGSKAAVTPVAPPGSGDGRVSVAWAEHGSPLAAAHARAHAKGDRVILGADHKLAQQAFAAQTLPTAS